MSAIECIGADFSAPISCLGMYSDGMPMVKTEEYEDIVRYADTVVIRHTGLNSFVTAMFLVDSINSNHGRIDNLVIPYLPGARQDRVNVSGDVLDTAWSISQMINQRNFGKVVVLDPHSVESTININNLVKYPLERVANKMWSGYTGIIAPDRGSRARAEAFANFMQKPIFYGSKSRSVVDGKITGFDLEEIPAGGHYLVVDDICDGGGTFQGLADCIDSYGSYADLYVSHGIFSRGIRSLKERYKNIYTTDSFEAPDGVYQIKIVKDMINYV